MQGESASFCFASESPMDRANRRHRGAGYERRVWKLPAAVQEMSLVRGEIRNAVDDISAFSMLINQPHQLVQRRPVVAYPARRCSLDGRPQVNHSGAKIPQLWVKM